MKFGPAKTARVLLALALLLAWTLPACAGTDGCTMPCCRAKSKPVGDPAAKPCCQQPAASACRFTTDCPFAHPHALTSAAPAAPTGALTAALDPPGAPPL